MSRFFSKIVLLISLAIIPSIYADASIDESVTKAEKSYPEAYRFEQSGVKKYNAKDYDGAIADFTRAIELWPEFAQAYYLRANSKSWINFYKDKDERRADLDMAIKLNPNNADYYVARGNLRVCMTDWLFRIDNRGAIEDYNRAIELNPKYDEAYRQRADARYNLDDYREQYDDLTKAIDINPNVAAYYAARSKNMYNSYSVKDAEKAVALEPNNQSYLENRNYVRAKYREDAERYDKYLEQQRANDSQPSFWDRNAETLGNNLKAMQEGDAARRNADYRLQNNCSGANCVNR
ncbi:MAG: tetratricopeptide repeat protein [Sulfuricurvum sp.]|uniref:tetratricopeptide repeat protein n=1 Tax=Sulfuricurvum sp. TaxID=2025608 RepID=UPI0026114F47|nr:tetratricopeptide repeat protein [Sulfuricurvum sp.]MDD2829372.1 tetratricopeptide repeat protein [Sulfuricurvum sp.]MDD4949137.1 tetratricopeptide repeat protein [Sulfuricurvum sp.]